MSNVASHILDVTNKEVTDTIVKVASLDELKFNRIVFVAILIAGASLTYWMFYSLSTTFTKTVDKIEARSDKVSEEHRASISAIADMHRQCTERDNSRWESYKSSLDRLMLEMRDTRKEK